jgi:hypothetical protein
MKKIIYSLVMLLMANTAFMQKAAIVASDKTGWHKIGETKVDFTKEEDEVAVLLADKFAMLKFKVTNAPIELLDLDVIFEEGDKQNIRVGYAIKSEGSESRPIDLKGGAERKIKRIVFRYRTVDKAADQKAHVEIWGKKTNPDKGTGKSEMKKEGNEVKKDAKETGREVKKESREAGREVKKEAREVKKEAREEKNEMKEDMKKD